MSGFLSDDRWLRDVARERRERSAEFVADVARLLGVDPPESAAHPRREATPESGETTPCVCGHPHSAHGPLSGRCGLNGGACGCAQYRPETT